MIRFISHRGNINGNSPSDENNIDYINKALSDGYDVEVDVWLYNNKYYFGHDEPQYETNIEFICRDYQKLWFHAKNKEVLRSLLRFDFLNVFWHQNDDYTITSKGYIWVFPGKDLVQGSICVMPETIEKVQNLSMCFGICSDYIEKYRNELNHVSED